MDAQVEFAIAVAGRMDRWVPANGGTETPFLSRSGRRLLYVFNPSLGTSRYLDCDRDMVLTNEEAFQALGV